MEYGYLLRSVSQHLSYGTDIGYMNWNGEPGSGSIRLDTDGVAIALMI